MTDHDAVAFGEAMHALGHVFNEEITRIRIEGYFDALREFPMPQVTAAVRLTMRTCRFFPKPVELRELMTGRADARADLAWGELLREVRRVGYLGTPMFTDASMLPTIHTVFGGWRHLCETLPAGGPELVGWIKQFKSAYGTVDQRQRHEPLLAAANPDLANALAAIAASKAIPPGRGIQVVKR